MHRKNIVPAGLDDEPDEPALYFVQLEGFRLQFSLLVSDFDVEDPFEIHRLRRRGFFDDQAPDLMCLFCACVCVCVCVCVCGI